MKTITLWSEQPDEKLVESAPILKDYGATLAVAVTPQTSKKVSSLIDELYRKDVEVFLWPLMGRMAGFLLNGYFVNEYTAEKASTFVRTLYPSHLKYPNVSTVVLDTESWPVFGYFKKTQRARETLENLVEEMQQDLGKDAMTMEWYWGWFDRMWDLPILRNARRRSMMVYTSMSPGRVIPQLRIPLISSAINDGKKKYGQIPDIHLGATSTGVWRKIFYPFSEILTYRNPDQIVRELNFLKENGVERSGVYTIDTMHNGKLKPWLNEIFKN